jgi:Ankyrin repeat
MGASLSGPAIFDPFSDRASQRFTLKKHKGGSPSTSSSSLASTASMIEATGNIIMGSNAPPLYEHALVGDWKSLLRRILSHPKEACYKDKCQNMPLHVACRRQPPPAVVEALIKANPDALVSQTHDGLTPLHFSCFCGSAPETSYPTRSGLRNVPSGDDGSSRQNTVALRLRRISVSSPTGSGQNSTGFGRVLRDGRGRTRTYSTVLDRG